MGENYSKIVILVQNEDVFKKKKLQNNIIELRGKIALKDMYTSFVVTRLY